ncbi:hypothetical protein [Marinigracilibium pacificum]|uniref:Uncharacterized protein n=1 Tax=Marinigracilibium pacificum TaxID=2729599 RepID=A0A848J5Y8_9BACT|nr:hypothetical protein [Marinigracilibium pacificum]NMM50658.1 hypothetical protein [Marinigracilibium pacificum]
MKQFNNVEYSKPIELFGLLISTFILFFLLLRAFSIFLSDSIFSLIISLSGSIIFYILLKKRIIKKADFLVSNKSLKWNNNEIEYSKILWYRINWMKGASIKLKLVDGSVFRLSANSTFINSEDFIKLAQHLDKKLITYGDEKIIRKNSFGESKSGFIIMISLTIILIGLTIFKITNDKEFNISNIGLIIISLSTLWSGIKLK